MQPIGAQCAHLGCSRSRIQNSAFCEEHHQEQQRRAGLISDVPADPAARALARCLRLISCFEDELISRDELSSSLFDYYVVEHGRGEGEYWAQVFIKLPEDVLRDLLAYVTAETQP